MTGYIILAFGCLTFGAIIGLLVAGLCAEAANADRLARAAKETAEHLQRAHLGWVPGPYRHLTETTDAADVVPISLARRQRGVMP